MKLKHLLLLSASLAIFSSCSKDEDNDNSTPAPTGSTPSTVPQLSDANGVMVAVKSITYTTTPVGSFPLPIGTAVAVFSDTAGSSTFVSAGTVECENNLLSKQSNNSYVFTPSATAPAGIDFGSVNNPAWEVQGSGSIPSISRATTSGFPSGIDSVSNGSTINRSNDYTLAAAGNISNSDSVLFIVSGPSATLSKTLTGNSSSCTFTAAEMGTIGAGSGIVQIVPYNIESTVTGNKKFYFVNEIVVSRTVTIN